MTRRLLPILLILLCAGAARAQVDPDHNHTDDPGPHPVCGTFDWIAAHSDEWRDWKDTTRGIHSIQIACDNRPTKQFNRVSAQKHFRVHWDISGRDSVSIVDTDGNSIPDYIDSTLYYLERTWEVEINEFGYPAPPPDNRGLGPELDVYICNLGGIYYGLARPEEDNRTGPNTVHGFLVLENDYSAAERYPSTGIKGLRVTIAHEFHHLIQFSRYRYDFSQAGLYEATSVWLERQLAPEILDYLQYVKEFLLAPHNIGFSTQEVQRTSTGYAHVLYLEYLEKKIDRDVVRKIWDRFASNGNMFDAIDQVLREYGMNLENSFCEFAEWCYYTGTRAQGDKYFKDARLFPTMRAATVPPRAFDGEDLLIQGYLFPLSFGLYQVTLPTDTASIRDTVDFLITNARTDFGKGGPMIGRDTFELELTEADRNGYRPLGHGSDTVFFKLRAQSPQFCVNPLFGGKAVSIVAMLVSPQPFINDGGSTLVFGVSLSREQVQHAKLWIYTSTLTRVCEIEITELQSFNNQLGILWNGKDNNGNVGKGWDHIGNLVPSGIYIYELSINNQAPTLGKFAVIKK